jgi:uncharacterized membrane protein
MRLACLLLIAHLGALAFGLAGLLVALPRPELWAGDPTAARVFDFGMRYAGSLHIVLGAAAMLAFGFATVGRRRTALFFALAVAASLAAELLGTATGWPFGDYAYTDFLGYKILGRVPFGIPLSWFSLGFAAYLLGGAAASRFGLKPGAVWTVAIGAWLLTVWDLVLDPAMAHEAMPVRFWEWRESGAYHGTPLKNFAGWAATGVAFMAPSRVLWREDVVLPPRRAWFPFVVYAANVGFGMALAASVGLTGPILLAAILGLAPAVAALVPWSGYRALAPPERAEDSGYEGAAD